MNHTGRQYALLFAILLTLGSALAFTVSSPVVSNSSPQVGDTVDINLMITKTSGETISDLNLLVTDGDGTFDAQLIDCYSLDLNYEISENVTSPLTLSSANMPYDTLGSGGVNNYFNFHGIVVPAGEDKELLMTLRNDTNATLNTDSINTSYRIDGGIWHDFQLFILHVTVPAIPEFGFAAIPVLVVLASAFVFLRR